MTKGYCQIEIMRMNQTVSDYVHMHKQIEKHKADAEQINNPGQISNLQYLLQQNKQIYLNIFSDTDGGGYSSDRRQSVSSGSVPQIVTSTNNTNNSSSLYTLIFHGFHEDWMEKVWIPTLYVRLTFSYLMDILSRTWRLWIRSR